MNNFCSNQSNNNQEDGSTEAAAGAPPGGQVDVEVTLLKTSGPVKKVRSTTVEILLRGGKLSAADADEAEELSHELQEPAETVLKRCWGLDQHDLTLAKEAAVIVDGDQMNMDLLISAFRAASERRISLGQGLKYFGVGL